MFMRRKTRDFKTINNKIEAPIANKDDSDNKELLQMEIIKLAERRETRAYLSRIFIFSVTSIIIAACILRNSPEIVGCVATAIGGTNCIFIRCLSK